MSFPAPPAKISAVIRRVHMVLGMVTIVGSHQRRYWYRCTIEAFEKKSACDCCDVGGNELVVVVSPEIKHGRRKGGRPAQFYPPSDFLSRVLCPEHAP